MLWTFITFVLMVASTGATLVATGVLDANGLAGRSSDTRREAAAGVQEGYEELTGTDDDFPLLPGVDVEVTDDGEFTAVCHRTGDEQRTLVLPRTALAAHLAHGDTRGACAPIAATPSARHSAGTAPEFGAEGQDQGGTSGGGRGQPLGHGPKTGANAEERHNPDHRATGLGNGKEAAPTGDDDDAD